MTVSLDPPSDAELIQAFVQRRSEDAFAQIVERHGPAVYGSARRQLGDSSLADDVTQAVFILLTRRAGSIRRPELLGGWLMKATRYCVLTVRRSERRRTEHEARAAHAAVTETVRTERGTRVSEQSGENSSELLPAIDEALSRLGTLDQAIITLSVLESRPQVEIARTLNLSADAVRKRLPRAIEKIRRELSRLGVAVSAEGMALALQPLSLQTVAMPHGLLARVMASHASAHAVTGATVTTAAHTIASAVSRQLTIKASAFVAATVAGLVLWGGGAGLWFGFLRSAAPATLASALVDVARTQTVYYSPGDPAKGWSLPATGITPRGRQAFLGPFGNQDVSLRLNNLPKHDFVRVQADLYVMNTWDGVGRLEANLALAGPDFWSLRLDDRPALVRSTFSATPDDPVFAFGSKLQTFPAIIPGRPHRAGTGAYQVNGLGYVFDFSPTLHFPMDGAYHFDLTLPHSADAMTLTVGGDGLSSIGDESWGITNVKIDAVAAADVAKPTGDEFQNAWRTLTGPDPVAAYTAFWTLVAGGDATVGFLQQQLLQQAVAAPVNSADVLRRLPYLNDADPEVAFSARADLIAMGPVIESLLTPAASGANAGSAADDAARRDVLERIELRPIAAPADSAAAARAKVLAAIHTPAAATALRTWLDAGRPWTPTALRQFESAYHLPAGVNVLHVTGADPSLRAIYLRERRAIAAGAQLNESFVQDADDAGSAPRVFVLADPTPNFWTPAFALFDSGSPGWTRGGQHPPVRQLLNQIRRTHPTDWLPVQIDPAVLNTTLHGDWVIRRNAPSQAAQLTELAAALSSSSGKRVTASGVDIPQISVLLVGTPRLTALSTEPRAVPAALGAAATASASLPSIHLYADELDRAAAPAVRQIVSLRNLPAYLARYGRRLAWDTAPANDARVELCFHPATHRAILPDDTAAPENAVLVDSILSHLAAQLNVTLKAEARPQPGFRLGVAE